MFSAIIGCLLWIDTPVAPAVPLERGQEIVWKGTFKEEVIRPGVTGTRTYSVENRLFVLESHDRGADVAIITVLKLRSDKEPAAGPGPTVARLVLGRIDLRGRLTEQPSASLSENLETRLRRKTVPFEPPSLDALPIPELGMLPTLPEDWKTLANWEMPELGRPLKHWKNEGPEAYRSARCTLIQSEQHNDGWDHPGRQSGYRIRENAWISAVHGYALKFDRTTERTNAGTGVVEFRSVITCEQGGQLRYGGKAYDERREEISTAAGMAEECDKLMQNASRTGPTPFVKLLARIDHYTVNQRPLGESLIYRESLNATKRKAEAAMRGHVAPEPANWTEKPTGELALDRLMVDFDAENANGDAHETWRLSRAKGKPVLLLYYQPHAESAPAVLRAGQALQREYRDRAAVVGMAIGNADAARKQAADLHVEIPLLSVNELRKAQGIQSTPSMVLIDADGVVRKIAVGWGDESLGILREELGKYAK